MDPLGVGDDTRNQVRYSNRRTAHPRPVPPADS
jgi:hypothetical protein